MITALMLILMLLRLIKKKGRKEGKQACDSKFLYNATTATATTATATAYEGSIEALAAALVEE